MHVTSVTNARFAMISCFLFVEYGNLFLSWRGQRHLRINLNLHMDFLFQSDIFYLLKLYGHRRHKNTKANSHKFVNCSMRVRDALDAFFCDEMYTVLLFLIHPSTELSLTHSHQPSSSGRVVCLLCMYEPSTDTHTILMKRREKKYKIK